jgi:hypothetical protein
MKTYSSFNVAQLTGSKDELYLLTRYTSSTVANIYIYIYIHTIRYLLQRESSLQFISIQEKNRNL